MFHPEKNTRKGAAAIEAALILPVLIFVTLGAIDIAQYINTSQTVVNASREGARIASRNSTDKVSEIEEAVLNYLGSIYSHLSESELAAAVDIDVYQQSDQTIQGGDMHDVESGDPLTVNVTFDFADIRWLAGPAYWNGNILDSTTISRRE